MKKFDIIFLIAVVEVGDLSNFTLDELSDFWSAFTVCRNDKKFFAEFSAKEKKDIIAALEKLEAELKRRNKEPVNFFQLMQDDPEKVEWYLKKFSLMQLLELDRELKEFKKSAIVVDFLKLVRKQICQRVPIG